MSRLLSCQSLSKSFGPHRLFSELSLGISEGERLGLIGPNGSGKSTLLKIFAGIESPDDGKIFQIKLTRLVYLPQKDSLDSHKSVEQNLLDSLSGDDIEDVERFNRVHRMISLAGFSDAGQNVAALSGGWRKRLAISCALIREPDVLLMDEPTNHLDLDGIFWLEKLLANATFAFAVVSHDRYFLENTTNRIIELSRQYPEGYLTVEGNYNEFLIKRETFLKNQERQEEILSNKVSREIEWLRRGPKARTTKAQYRIDEAQRLQDELSSVQTRNANNKRARLDFDGTGRKTKKLLQMHDLGKSIAGRRLFGNLNITLTPGARLGLLGANGSGKSTLLHILCGDTQPDEGYIETADGLRIFLFEQQREQLNPEDTLRRALAPTGDSVVYRDRSLHVVTWAKRFLFEGDQLEMPVGELSGGEQARILIARLMLRPADILLLDEPTNDLDIPMLEVLEESLQDFPGALILVTHDRYLMDRVATQVLALDGSGGAGLFADYRQWLISRKHLDLKCKPGKPDTSPKSKKPQKKAGKLSYKDQREFDKIEEKIIAAEENVALWEKKIKDPVIVKDPDQLQECWDMLRPAQELVEQLYLRWEELEKLRSIEK